MLSVQAGVQEIMSDSGVTSAHCERTVSRYFPLLLRRVRVMREFLDVMHTRWALYVLSGHLPAGFIIGTLLPLRWRLSIATAWGAILINVMGPVGMLRSGELDSGPPVSFFARFAFPILTLFVVPATVALGGYAGSRVVTKWSRNSASNHGTGEAPRAS